MDNNSRYDIPSLINNYINYSSLDHLKRALNNYYNLLEMSELGYSNCTDILIDIKDALKNSNLTEIEKTCIIEREIKQQTLEQVAKKMNRSYYYVYNKNLSAINKIFQYLNRGDSDGQ